MFMGLCYSDHKTLQISITLSIYGMRWTKTSPAAVKGFVVNIVAQYPKSFVEFMPDWLWAILWANG